MHWRPIREADLLPCLNLQPACVGDGITGRDAALRVWRSWLQDPAFHGTVMESEVPVAGQKIVGCGLGVFVTAPFASREIADPKPGLNARIIAGVAQHKSVVLNRAEIAAGNAGGGLDFVNLYGTWREGALNADQLAEVQALLGTSFVDTSEAIVSIVC